MDTFEEFLAKIEVPEHRERTAEVLQWVFDEYPELEPRIAWKGAVFTHHGTYIIGFSTARNHLAFSPEGAGIRRFVKEIEEAGYKYGKMNVFIPWSDSVSFELLKEMIAFNIEDKAECRTFWRK